MMSRIYRRQTVGAPSHAAQAALLLLRPALGIQFRGTDAPTRFHRSLTCGAEFSARDTAAPFVPKRGVVGMFPERVAVVASGFEGPEVPHETAG